jgi:hypothetical protein
MENWVEIFRKGKYDDWEFKESHLDEIVNNFKDISRKFYEVPITLDHKNEGIAFGWVENLKAEDGTLYATFKDVDDYLKYLVNNKRMPKRSVEIIPTAEYGMRLRAVTFIGAASPKVKGMRDFVFDEKNNDKVISIDFQEIIKKTEETKEMLTEIQIKELQEKVKNMEFMSKELETVKKENSLLQQKKIEIEIDSKVQLFKEELKKENKFIPALDKIGIFELYKNILFEETIGNQNVNPINFTENGVNTSKKQSDILRDTLKAISSIETFTEKNKDLLNEMQNLKSSNDNTSIGFSEQEVLNFQKKHNLKSFTEAYNKMLKGEK